MFYYKLNNRSLISFEGKDVISFLQAIITNDVNKLKKNNPALAKAAEDHKQSYDDFKDELEKAIKARASK